MSILVQDPTAPLIAGAVMVRETDALGIRGDALPVAPAGLESFLTPCVDLPGDSAVEFRGEVIANDLPAGFFQYYDDGSFKVVPGCPDGVYTFTFRLWADGVADPTLVTSTVVVGVAGVLAINATMDDFTASISLMTPTNGSLSINAVMLPFTSNLSFIGDLVGPLPAVLSPSRQYRINPDVHVDAYAIQQQFALTWEKDPDATLDYSLEWIDWLAEIPGDGIANIYITTTAGIQVPAQGIVNGTVTGVMAKGGVVGTTEEVTIRIATTQGRIDERTIQLSIRQR